MSGHGFSRLQASFEGARVVLAGRIDDHLSLNQIIEHIPVGAITVDTAGIGFVNSIGMREWMRFVRALRQRGTLTLERVADVLMTQMNMIPEFTGVTITSFHAQYVCPACGAEAAPLVDAVANADALRQMKAPLLPCSECGAKMELGDFPERYLSVFGAQA